MLQIAKPAMPQRTPKAAPGGTVIEFHRCGRLKPRTSYPGLVLTPPAGPLQLLVRMLGLGQR